MPHSVKPSAESVADRSPELFIQVEGVVKKFGEFTAVDNVDLEIYLSLIHI